MTQITLGLEWFLNPDHVPFVLAGERGYYDEVDLAVEIWEPPEHHDTLDMLATGDLDYAITEPIHLVEDRAEGVPVTGIARFLHTRGGIQYPTDQDWNSPADLEAGVRLNYPGAPGPGGRKMVAYMAQEAGGTLRAEDIVPVDRGFYHTDAIVDGDADIAFLAFYNFEIIESQHRAVPTALWELGDYGVPDFNQLILTAADEKLATAPEEVRRFLAATKRGVEDTIEDPEAAIKQFFERHPAVRDENPALMEKITEATVACFTSQFAQDREMYRDLVDFCVELGLAAQRVEIDAIVDERFTP